MVRMHVWLRRKEGMSPEQFRDYWVNTHAPIARDGYASMTGYEVNVVTRVAGDGGAPYDGLAVLTWGSRDAFKADMASPAMQASTDDLANFTSASGVLFVETDVVK